MGGVAGLGVFLRVGQPEARPELQEGKAEEKPE
jgi:hypothetical protein